MSLELVKLILKRTFTDLITLSPYIIGPFTMTQKSVGTQEVK